jgi:hypothetical protein
MEKALQTQLENIEKKTGKSLQQLSDMVRKSGLSKHGEIRDMLKASLGLGHGDANTVAHIALQSDGASAAKGKGDDAVLDEIYSGAKAPFRPVHDKLMKAIAKFGEFEVAPKKGYVSLRRKKQFAMIGPKTSTRFEVGINAKDLKGNSRLEAQPKGSMCNFIVKLTDAKEVDAELIGWLKAAYEGAG